MTLGADVVMVIVPPAQAAVMRTKTIFRVAWKMHGKRLLRIAYVEPGLESIDLSQINRLTIRGKESGRFLGLIAASSQMSCRSCIGPAAPLAILLTLSLFRGG
jgi:hypothetical protein